MNELDSGLFPCTIENSTSVYKNSKGLLNHDGGYHQLDLLYEIQKKKKDEGSSKPDSGESDIVHSPLPRHSYAEAVVQGCQSMHANEDERAKALIEDNESSHKPEYNAFTHPVNIKRMIGRRLVCHPIVPAKRNVHKSSSWGHQFARLVHFSHLRNILVQRQYFELYDQACQMLNSDWEYMPNIKYACAQALAGCILVNERADHANVCPCVLTTSDGEKLIIGTQTSNALITSTIRIDIKEEPKVGPTTCNSGFPIKKDPWEKTAKLSKDPWRDN
ncbi:hypothetical protein BX666DRAFT_2017601 [Dichotomocladium elegans]|nr:hypothetical protein BX666DRAFT_2017601 [Dichotomocladium elegans]